ncbi:MAG: phosphatase PAP2 family protein [Geothrix sp.]|uniref:acid phosphatase n=1 Tax=Geothrix sp. TaxID=1962974 RepID=UPI00185A2AAD|nr:phosphatase PAP2 family protein [Geothrix sp.]NWJ41553.1 phosphatase PAP2 family protein [Geothrix sp.]WIL20463.1 MAG: phosphatase PAP2 family protein [Geothrix sp.]
MRRSFTIPVLALALLLPGAPSLWAQAPAQADQAKAWATFLGAPPAVDSDGGKADLAIVLWHQRTRTAPEVQRALSEVKLGLGAYAQAIGVPLEEARYPKTAALIDKVGKDIKVVTDGLKKHFMRPRPYQADPRVRPAIELETSPSYPSGHATRGLAYAMVLADLVPEWREALLAQGRLVGVDRVIGGVHYPSDIEAGQRLAEKLGAAWLADPQNRTLVEAARAAEWPGLAKP